MPIDLYLKNARVVLEDGIVEGGVLVAGETIADVVKGAPQVDARESVDLQGRYLLPGVVDAHVHFNQPGRDHWEGYRTGTMAAAAGGITTILEMPLNATPPTIDAAQFDRKRAAVKDDAVVDYGLWGGIVNDNLSDLPGLHERGAIGFKGFMSASGVDFARVDDDLIYAGLLESKRLGNLIGLHAESEYVTGYLGRQMQASGRTDRASWHESRPPFTELEAVERACYWAGVTGGNLHIVHVSIAAGIAAITRAKQNGVHVTAETCPHYLCLDEDDFVRLGPAAKCAPPLRSRENVEALWQCVLAGQVDTLGSDHSPCPWDDKAPGLENIWKAWGGIQGVQTMLPALLTEGVHRRGLSLPALMKMLAANPARLFGLYPRKGAIMPGADADLVALDLDHVWTLTVDQLLYKNKHSAYVGREFRGRVQRTWVRGQTVYADGQIKAEPGYGKWLRRETPYAY